MPSALKLLKKGTSRDANPFEIKYSKTKHSIFNKKVKGEKGKPALSRKRGIQKRQETIGQELKKKTKANAFQDKRFGEFSNLSMEDKLLSRNKMLAEKKFSQQNFNFENQVQLTHSGQSLDAFQEGGLEKVYDSDSGELSRDIVENIHFGGFPNEKTEKSKNEVYQEIIQKSKMFKLERKMAKEADEELTREVDDELKDIRDLLVSNSSVKDELPPVRRFADGSFRNDEDYDRYVKELIYEKRAQASERLKTEEELAIEEKMKLEKLEKERLQRMNGLTQSKNKRVSQADDLDDGMDFEDNNKDAEQPLVYQDGVLLNKEIFFKSAKKQKRQIEEGLDEEEDQTSGSEADSNENDSEESSMSESENESEDESENDIASETGEIDNFEDTGKMTSAEGNSLPFTFEAPTLLSEFVDLTVGRSEEEIDVIIRRIRVLYNKRLHPDNKKKLETLLLILFEYVEKLPREEEKFTVKCNTIGKHIVQLSEEFLPVAVDYSIEKIKSLRSLLSKGEAGTHLRTNMKGMMPRAPELAFFKTLLLTYPGSDLYHPIMTPLILLMAQYLEMAVVRNDQDLVAGIMLCEYLFITQNLSKRYIPEALNFLISAVSCFSGNTKSISPCFLRVKLDGYNECLTCGEIIEPDLNMVLSPNQEITLSQSQRLFIFGKVLSILSDFTRIYSDLPSWIELCEPLSIALEEIEVTNLKIKDQISHIKDKLASSIASAKLKRVPLELLKRKPIPIKTYTPQFEKHYSVDKKYNPNKEKAEFAKLKFQHKQEFKGAIRELKKDAEFIARAKMVELKEKDAEYKRKMDKIMGQLASQEGAMRGYEREKKKSKRKL